MAVVTAVSRMPSRQFALSGFAERIGGAASLGNDRSGPPYGLVTAVGRQLPSRQFALSGFAERVGGAASLGIAALDHPTAVVTAVGRRLPSWCVGACPRLANNSAAAGRCRNDPLWTTLPRKLPAIRGLPRTRRADRRGSRFPLSAFPFPLFPETPARAASTAGG